MSTSATQRATTHTGDNAATRLLSRRAFLGLFAGTLAVGIGCVPSSPAPPQPPAAAGQQTAATTPGSIPTATGASIGAIKLGVITALFDNAFILAPMHAGIYKQAGIDLSITEFQDGNTMTRAVVSDQIDTGEMGIPQIFPADEAGADLKLVAAPKAKLNFVFVVQKDINSLEDLYGKEVGTNGINAQLHKIVVSLYRAKGADPSKLIIANVGPSPQVTRALIAGRVPAGAIVVSDLPQIKNNPDLKVLYDCGQELPNYLRLGMPVRQQVIASHDGLLRQFFIAHSFAHRWALQHREEVIKSAVDDVHQDESAAAANWDTYVNGNMVSPDFTITEAQIDYMQQLNLDDGSQKAKLPTDRVLDTRYIQAVQEVLGPYRKS